MSDQAGLFDLPGPVPPRPPARSGRGRARETFARTVVADVSVHDAGALRGEALGALDHSVVIGEADDEDDDLPDLREEIATSLAAAVQWCVEPTMGMGPLLESGAIRIDRIELSAEERSAGLVQVAWTVIVKILDAAAVRELALMACPATDVATHTEIEQSFAALDALDWTAVPVSHQSTEAGHGRTGRRTIQVMDAPDHIASMFPHISQVFLIERYVTRKVRKRSNNSRRYTTVKVTTAVAALGITSLSAREAAPGRLAGYVRGHWGIEVRHDVALVE